MTQDGLAEFLAARLLSIVRDSRARALAAGLPPPELFDISPNDWDGRCTCSNCRAAADRTGGDGGLLLDLVNRVSALVRGESPDVRLTTLAYTWTFEPPTGGRAAPGVIVRVSGYGIRDQIRAAVAPTNERFRRGLLGWASIAPGLWVWDYAVTYHDHYALPLPNLRTFSPDFRWYREIGVDGLFLQFGFPLAGELHDLKVWVVAKLAEDPDRDAEALVREFTTGYYGPAARQIRRYIRLTEAAADATGVAIDADAEPMDYRWLDDDFLARAGAIFDKAEGAVRHDAVFARRVREARAALDWAVLRFGAEGSPDRTAAAKRLRRTWSDLGDTRVAPGRRAEFLEWVDDALGPGSR